MKWHTIRIALALLICSQPSCNIPTGKKHSSEADSTSNELCIKYIVSLDDSLSALRNHDCESVSISESIYKYTAGIGNASFEDCPEDFVRAYKRHQQAWLEMLRVTDKYTDLRGEMHQLFNSIQAGKDSTEFKQRLQLIWSTWDEIKNAAHPFVKL